MRQFFDLLDLDLQQIFPAIKLDPTFFRLHHPIKVHQNRLRTFQVIAWKDRQADRQTHRQRQLLNLFKCIFDTLER